MFLVCNPHLIVPLVIFVVFYVIRRTFYNTRKQVLNIRRLAFNVPKHFVKLRPQGTIPILDYKLNATSILVIKLPNPCKIILGIIEPL